MLMSNRNARNPMRHFNGFSSVCTVLATPHCSCINNNTSSAVSIRCSATSTGTINFSLTRAAYSSMLLVDSLRFKVLFTLKVTQRKSMESTCQRNVSLLTCCFSGSICLSNKKLSAPKRL